MKIHQTTTLPVAGICINSETAVVTLIHFTNLKYLDYTYQFTRNKMRTAVIVLLVVTVLGGSNANSIRSRRAVEEFVRRITYTQDKQEISQKVTVTETEAKFQVKSGLDAVIDYKQNLFVYADSPAGDVCYVSKFDIPSANIPSLETIKKLSGKGEGSFPKPSAISGYSVSHPEKPIPEPELLSMLSKLSKEMCEGKKLKNVQLIKSKGTNRQKRDVGAGEVVLIIVVIVIFAFLG